MAFNFNNDPLSPFSPISPMSPGSPAAKPEAPANGNGPTSNGSPNVADAPATSDVPESAAFVRFRSCRWQQPKDDAGGQEFCTHREVKPYAGTTGFDADAWCPDCQYYKLRRAPKKREPRDDYSY